MKIQNSLLGDILVLGLAGQNGVAGLAGNPGGNGADGRDCSCNWAISGGGCIDCQPGGSGDTAGTGQNGTDGPVHAPSRGRARASACVAAHHPSHSLRPGRPRHRFSSILHFA